MGDTAKVVGQQEVGPCPGRRHPPTTSSGPSHLSPMLPVYSVTYVPRLLRQSWRVSQAKSRSANRGFALFAPPCDIRLFPLACPVDEWPKVVHETFYVDLDPPDPASPFVWRQRPISDLSRICPRQNQPRPRTIRDTDSDLVKNRLKQRARRVETWVQLTGELPQRRKVEAGFQCTCRNLGECLAGDEPEDPSSGYHVPGSELSPHNGHAERRAKRVRSSVMLDGLRTVASSRITLRAP